MSNSVSEVEEILREIRLRVQHENLASTQIARRAAEKSPLDLTPDERSEPLERRDTGVPADPSHVQARLNTLDKTRNNLPPIASRRTGLAARTELFVKRQIKRMTKWFTWDQVTFNTAVYETLVEQQKILISSAQELASCAQEQARLREFIAQVAEKHRSDASAEIEDLRSDLSQRLIRLEDQQAVIYKNLLIQVSEMTAVAERSRRSLEERVAVLESERRSS